VKFDFIDIDWAGPSCTNTPTHIELAGEFTGMSSQ